MFVIHETEINKLPYWIEDLRPDECGSLRGYIIGSTAHFLPVNDKPEGYHIHRAYGEPLDGDWESFHKENQEDPLWAGNTWQAHNGAEDITPKVLY